MLKVTDAVILMAGAGSRLRASRGDLPKPLMRVAGQPLISYVLNRLMEIGVRTVHAVVGWESERLLAGLHNVVPSGIQFQVIHNPDWAKQNGISLLCAEGNVRSPFLLTMADHLFDSVLLERFVRQSEPNMLNLAIDTKVASIFDLDDAMKVRTNGTHVIDIGKDLTTYNAVDTGVFLCPQEIFSYLRDSISNEDCALADGVRLMAAHRKVRAIDIGDAWWQDVDTPAMLKRAEDELQTRVSRRANHSFDSQEQTHDREA